MQQDIQAHRIDEQVQATYKLMELMKVKLQPIQPNNFWDASVIPHALELHLLQHPDRKQ